MRDQPDRRPMTVNDLWEFARVGTPLPATDGSFVIVPVTTYDVEKNEGTTRLYLAGTGTGGGEPRALTSEDRSATQPALCPDMRTLAFLRKPSGKENAQVHLMPLDGGESRRLTDFPLGVADVRWLPDGEKLVCLAYVYRDAMDLEGTRKLHEQRGKDPVKAHVSEDRLVRFWDQWLTDGRVPHLFLVDATSGETVDLTPESTRWFAFMDPGGEFDISPEGTEIVFSANTSEPPHAHIRWALFTVPVAGGPVTCLTPDNPAEDIRPRYSPDGRYILYGMQREWDFYADRVRLVRIDRRSGESKVLTEEWDHSTMGWEFTPGSDAIVLEAESRGRSNIYRLSIEGGIPKLLARGGTAHAPRATGDGHVYFQLQDLAHAPEIARCSVTGDHPEKRELVTHFNDALHDRLDLGTVEELEIQGADHDPVQLYVIYPPGFDAGERWPLVHLIHGGPHGIFGDQFHFRWNAQVFASQGYVVVMTNFHGSTSFGQDFATSIMGSWGDYPMTDLMAATDALIERGFVDPDRVAVTGGSYGGYMTAWLTSQTDRFACAVCHAGVINLPGMYGTDITQGLHRSQGGVPWDGRDAMERWSPVAFADGFKTPTLVIHGENDYRVPVTQGLELYGILKAMGVEARLVHYPDENHWILKPQNSIHWYGEVFGWLERFLKTGGAARTRAVESPATASVTATVTATATATASTAGPSTTPAGETAGSDSAQSAC